MKKYTHLLVIALVALFILPTYPAAFGQNDSKFSDSEIASIALVANQVGINYAKIAKEKSSTADITKFADAMINDHMQFISATAAFSKKSRVAPKDNELSQKILNDAAEISKSLRSKSGRAFDKAYIDNEIAYHKFVINTLSNQLIPQTEDQKLKKVLESIHSSFKVHLQQAMTLQKTVLTS